MEITIVNATDHHLCHKIICIFLGVYSLVYKIVVLTLFNVSYAHMLAICFD